MRDRLIKLLNETFAEQYEKRGLLTANHTADHLLAEGVIVTPCKVGDTVYQTDGIRIYELEVNDVSLNLNNYKPYYDTESIGFDADAIGKSIFRTREEAEKALAKMKGGAE